MVTETMKKHYGFKRVVKRAYNKKLLAFVGILSDEEGQQLLSDLAAIKEVESARMKKSVVNVHRRMKNIKRYL